MATLLDSYSESNASGEAQLSDLQSGSLFMVGQSFTGDGGTLATAKFYIKKGGSPTGNANAHIYAHSGTYGTSSVATGSPLATSDNFDVSTLTTSYQLIEFTFSGANKITLTNGTYYVIVLQYDDGLIETNYVSLAYDYTSSTHSGNLCANYSVNGWVNYSTLDACFYVYKDDPTTTSTSSTSSSSSTTTTSSSSSSTSTTSSSSSTSTTSSSTSTTSSSTSTTSSSTSTTTTSSSTTSTSSTSTSSTSSSSSTTSTSTSTTSSSSTSTTTTLVEFTTELRGIDVYTENIYGEASYI